MWNSSIVIIGIFVIFFTIIVGVIILQIFLSKKKNQWLGMILPLMCIIFSIIAVVGIGNYTTLTSSKTVKEYDDDGNIVNSQVVINDLTKDSDLGKSILNGILVFCIYNIPTVTLLGIYYASRERKRIDLEINKMKIKDL